MGRMSGRKKLDPDVFTAAALGDLRWLEVSLAAIKPGTITYDRNGLAPIHLSALHGRLDCLKLLIEKQNVDVNLPSSTGWRPVHLCVSNQTGDRAVKCLQYLLDKGADPTTLNDDSVTPAHQAASEGHIQCLKILMEAGASIDITDKRGHRPLDLAKLWGHRKCARILASELWHQDKAGIADDMVQLRKDRMEQVLRDLEKQESKEADSTFYGQLAFSEWLDKHGLPPTAHTEPSNAKNRLKKIPDKEPKASKSKDRVTDSRSSARGAKANSTAGTKTAAVTAKPHVDKRKQAGETVGPPRPIINPKAKTEVVTKIQVNVEPPPKVELEEPAVPVTNAGDTDDTDAVETVAPANKTDKEVYENPNAWNKSCKVRETFNDYQPILTDAYPRDIFTMMPTKDATPWNLNIRNPKIFVSDDEHVERADEVLNVRKRFSQVDLSPDVLPQDLSNTRPVLYHCQAVQDLPRRRPVTGVRTKLVCEGGMHLTDDVSSPFFQAGLVVTLPGGQSSDSSTQGIATS